MWLRDSTCQVRPYLRLAAGDAAMAGMIAGLIRRQCACILLDPYDVEAWASALERVLTDETEEARLRAAGPQQAAHFSWRKAAAQTWELYGKVLGDS